MGRKIETESVLAQSPHHLIPYLPTSYSPCDRFWSAGCSDCSRNHGNPRRHPHLLLPFLHFLSPLRVDADRFFLPFLLGCGASGAVLGKEGRSKNRHRRDHGISRHDALGSKDPSSVAAGFVLFRFFDIVNPSPIRHLERVVRVWGSFRMMCWRGSIPISFFICFEVLVVELEKRSEIF